MGNSEGYRRFINPLVLGLQKMELELTCPICHCITAWTRNGYDCPVCKVQFHPPDLRPAVHIEPMVNIYKSMNSTVTANLSQQEPQVDISDTKMPSGGSPVSNDQNDEKKLEEEQIHSMTGEKPRYMQSCAPLFGDRSTAKPRREGDTHECTLNESTKNADGAEGELSLKHREPYSPHHFGDQRDSDYDSNDSGSEPRVQSSPSKGSSKGASKVECDQIKEDRESKRPKLSHEIKAKYSTADVNSRDASVFDTKSVYEHEYCPNTEPLHATDCIGTNGFVDCAFCHSLRSTEASGPMLHYLGGKPVAKAEASEPNVMHVHQNCIEWAPQAFFAGETVVNLDAELARASKIKCSSCGLRGAALGCYAKSCRRSFHMPCAVEIPKCRWDYENFLMLCPVHSSNKLPCDRSKANTKTKANHSSCFNSRDNLTSSAKQQGKKLWTALPSVTREWMLCGSALSKKDKDILDEFVDLTGLAVTTNWKPNVTHVIAATDEHGACSRTLKVLMAILDGKWVLNVDWLKACMQARHPVAEEPYEINHDVHGSFDGPKTGRIKAMQQEPKLFAELSFYFSGHFTPDYKGCLESLILAASGTVSRKIETSATYVVYSTEPPQESDPDDHDKIIMKRKEEAEAAAGRTASRVVAHTWILDSIAACSVQENL